MLYQTYHPQSCISLLCLFSSLDLIFYMSILKNKIYISTKIFLGESKSLFIVGINLMALNEQYSNILSMTFLEYYIKWVIPSGFWFQIVYMLCSSWSKAWLAKANFFSIPNFIMCWRNCTLYNLLCKWNILFPNLQSMVLKKNKEKDIIIFSLTPKQNEAYLCWL